MFERNVVSARDPNVTTLSASFNGSMRNYTFKCHKDLAKSLVAGDLVAVVTSKGFGIAEVNEVHEKHQIDEDAQFEYQWAFQHVDKTFLKELEAREDQLIEEGL